MQMPHRTRIIRSRGLSLPLAEIAAMPFFLVLFFFIRRPSLSREFHRTAFANAGSSGK